MAEKKKVYVETSVISNLAARPSCNLIDMARQVATQQWWDVAVSEYRLVISSLVEREAAKGDADAAKRRLEILRGLDALVITREVEALANRLLAATAVPMSSYEDAVHIAAAAVGGVDYLVTWNCRHIANAATMPKIYQTCQEAGFKCPVICTPEQLGKEE